MSHTPEFGGCRGLSYLNVVIQIAMHLSLISSLRAASLILLLGQSAVFGQASFTGSYSQNFDSLGTSTSTSSLTGWSVLGNLGGDKDSWLTSIPNSGAPSAASAGTASTTLTLQSDAANATGTSNTNGFNYALSGSTSDRSLGFSPTSGSGLILQLRLTNNTSAAISAIRVGYGIRRFRNASSAEVMPGYRLFVSSDNGSTWTNVTSLNPVASGGTVNVPNTTGTTTIPLTNITLPSAVAVGSEVWFRWVDDNGAPSPDQIVGLDNVSIQLPVANALPTAALTAPAAGATFDAPATVNLTADATDTDGTISKVEFFRGAVKLGEDLASPYEFAWTNVLTGSYALTAVATDNLGGVTTSTAVNITVTNLDNVAPTVSLTAPANGSTILTNSVALAANAADTDGVVSKVEFFNGATKLGEDLTSPFTFNWTGVASGNYTLTAVATDNDSATTTSTAVNISVAIPIQTTLIARRPVGQPGAVWKYLDNGTDQGTAWKEATFNDSAWSSGAAPFGFGNTYVQTTLSFGPDSANKYITHYFRRTFEVTNPSAIQALDFNILRDDGVVVYINGVEVLRQNMPTGTINFQTLAPVNVEGTAEGVYNFSGVVPPPLLNVGTNVIAVELHNRALNSSDAGFDLEMISLAAPGIPPTVALTSPANGASFNTANTIALAADAADSDGTVTKVEFFAGATKLGEDMESPYTFDWSGMNSGAYALTARATDSTGNTVTSAAIDITVVNPNNLPPIVALTAPADGSIITTNSATLTATASDTGGSITKVEFFTGATKLGEDTTSPYSFNWTNVSGGAYILTAVATDNDGATTTSAPVNVSFAVPVVSTAIAKGAAWKYLDNGSNQGTAWKESAFNDSAWASGAGPLGGGDTHIVTNVNLGPASPDRFITTYLRRTFNITGASAVQSLLLNIMRDDGVVVYINGTEVARQNMPAGAVNHLTNAASIISGADETTYFPSNITTLPTLNEGANVIAVELHQRDGASSDLGFDLEMIVTALPGNPPTVVLTSPTNGASFTAPAIIPLVADASDSDSNGSIAKVEFFQGATKLGEDLNAPYEFNWTGVAQGNYTLTARATDNLGVTTTSAGVTITVNPPDTLPPVVSLTSPAGGATFLAPATIQLAANASDSDGIAKVEFFHGANKIGEDINEPYELTWSNVAAGSYTLTARATDTLTASTVSAPVAITVSPNQAPTVSLASPANAASLGSSGTVKLTANVSDPENQPLTVTFYGRPKNAPPGEDFTLVTLPDTQWYSQNSNNRIELFNNQTNWIVASKTALNTKFVAHMGDMTQEYNTIEAEFQRASTAMAFIENPATTLLTHGIPWGGAPGNHDIGSGGNTSFWNQYFGIARWAGRPYYGGGYNNANDNNYQLFSAGGMDFIIINLMYNNSTAGNQLVMDWADALLKANPNRRAIVTSHFLINTSLPPTQATWGGHGQAVYDNLKDNPNLFLMLCGHIHGEGRRADTFQGRTVNTVLQDYQSRSNGGDSWLRYFTFKPSENKIYAYTYKTNTAPVGNPLGGTFETDADSQFTLDYNMTATAPWTALGTLNLAGGETTATLAWNGLASNTEFEWYAAVSDPVNTPVGSTVRTFTTNGNAAPTVTLTSPSNGAGFTVPAAVPLAATAADIDGTITKVEFYQGATKLGEDTEAPFTFDWAAPAGSYSLTARATDGQGASTDSTAAAITVTTMIPEVTVTATDATAGEFGPDQTLVFTVSRTGPTTAPLNVQLSANGSAAPSSDYNGFATLFEIPASQASADLTLTVLADNLSEGPETVLLTVLPAALYNPGTPATAQATIADRPAQDFYRMNIADPAKRAPTSDADGDGNANVVEYFMGTLPGDAASKGILEIPSTGQNTFKVRYPRAKNRNDVSGSLRWSSNLTNWYTSGQSNGTYTVTFAEAVVSPEAADPETVEATASITGPGKAPQIFVRLGVD
jgi:hypothetical protein